MSQQGDAPDDSHSPLSEDEEKATLGEKLPGDTHLEHCQRCQSAPARARAQANHDCTAGDRRHSSSSLCPLRATVGREILPTTTSSSSASSFDSSASSSSSINKLPSHSEKFQSITSRRESFTTQGARDSLAFSTDGPAASGGGGISGALNLVLSKTISRRSLDPGPEPDGGIRAWTQAIMGHLVVFNVWGFINSFGTWQAYYAVSLNRPPSDISWIGSMQVFILFLIGAFSGRLTDYGLFRLTFLVGSVIYLLGVFMASLCTTYWQSFLAHGVCTGVGSGLLFCPCIALVSTYFSRRRAVALAIAASGTATGGMVFPVIAQQLLPKIGFAWTIRVIGFVMLATLALSFVFLKPRLPPRRGGPFVELAAFKEPPYLFFTIGMFFVFWGLYFAFYYLPSFGRNIIHLDKKASINELLIVNGVGVLGRLVPAYLSDRFFGPLNTLIPFVFGAGLLVYCWIAVDSFAGLTAFAVLFGIFGAGIQGLFPATLTSLTTDVQKTGVRIGMVFTSVSFASLTGPPIAGALIQTAHGSFVHAQIFAASCMLIGCAILAAARFTRVGYRCQRV